jgi:hypothetical protein
MFTTVMIVSTNLAAYFALSEVIKGELASHFMIDLFSPCLGHCARLHDVVLRGMRKRNGQSLRFSTIFRKNNKVFISIRSGHGVCPPNKAVFGSLQAASAGEKLCAWLASRCTLMCFTRSA